MMFNNIFKFTQEKFNYFIKTVYFLQNIDRIHFTVYLFADFYSIIYVYEFGYNLVYLHFVVMFLTFVKLAMTMPRTAYRI